jgi:hypothetical protein
LFPRQHQFRSGIQLGEPAIIPAGIESDHAKDGPPSIAMTLG